MSIYSRKHSQYEAQGEFHNRDHACLGSCAVIKQDVPASRWFRPECSAETRCGRGRECAARDTIVGQLWNNFEADLTPARGPHGCYCLSAWANLIPDEGQATADVLASSPVNHWLDWERYAPSEGLRAVVHAVVGAGAVVIRDVVALGDPARPVNRHG